MSRESWPPSWFASVRSRRRDTAARTEEILQAEFPLEYSAQAEYVISPEDAHRIISAARDQGTGQKVLQFLPTR